MPRREFNDWKKRDAYLPNNWRRGRLYDNKELERLASMIPNVPTERREATRKLLSLVITYVETDYRSLPRPAEGDRAYTLDVIRDSLNETLSTIADANDDSLAALYERAAEDEDHPADISLSAGSGRWRAEEDLNALRRLMRWADDAARKVEAGKSEKGRPAHEPEANAIAAIRQIWHFMSRDEISRISVARLARELIKPLAIEYRGKMPNLSRAVRKAFARKQPPAWPMRDDFKRLAQDALPK